MTGTPERPGLIGRIEAAPDGEVFLAGNTYRVERLVLDFSNPRAIAPDLSFLAQTRVGSAPIEVELLCPADGPLRAAGEVAVVGRHRRRSGSAAVRGARRCGGGRRAARASALRRGARRRLADREAGHAAARAGHSRPVRHLRRPDAGRGRRRSGLAPDARQASWRQRGARLFTEPHRERLHVEHHLPRTVRPLRPCAAARRSEPLVPVPARAPLRWVACGAAAAAARAARDGRADRRNAGLPGA